MKKKFIVFLIGISFLIFSCASTATESEPIETDSTEFIETDKEASTENQDEYNNIESSDNEADAENEEEEETEYEVPEDFVEPDVQDLELPLETEEAEITDSENTESVIEEPISSDEIELSPLQKDYPYLEEDDLINNLEEENIPELMDEESETDEENALESDENNAEASDTDINDITNELTDNLTDEAEEELDAESATENETEDDSYEQEIENPDVESEEIIIMPSRSVTLKRGENLEVVYPGSGWIYMGSLSEYNNLASRGRKLGATDTKYTLLAKEAGTQIHHFYKVDNLTGEYIDDYLEVIVLDKKGSSKTTVTAPEYQVFIPPKAERPAKASVSEKDNSTEAVTTIIENTEASEKVETETDSPVIEQTSGRTLVTEDLSNDVSTNSISMSTDDTFTSSLDDVISIDEDYSEYSQENNLQNAIDTNSLLENAIILYNDKKYQEANLLLSEFFEYSTDRIDEGLFLQGQIYEAESPVKDIKKSIENYEALIKNYPSSVYWNDANKRIKYLRRFYYLSN